MNKIWKIAIYEFKRHVFQKRFIFSILGIPLFFLFMVGMIFLLVKFQNNEKPIGIIDPGNKIDSTIVIPEAADLDLPVEIIDFSNEDVALAALEEEQIQAYFLLPENYPENTEVSVYFSEKPGDNAYDHFRNLLRANLLQNQSENTINRILEGFNPIIRTPDGLREFSERNAINLALPGIAGASFMFIILMSANYFSAIIAEEKENRTMEILATTVSPYQLMGGKIFGTIGVVLTQVLSWIILLFVAQRIAAGQSDALWLTDPIIKTRTILMVISILVPAYILYVSLITMVGATATNVQEGQQIAGMFIMPLSLSYMFLAVIMENPNSPLSVAISLFPLTAPTIMPLRAAFTVVPTNQLILCVAILILCAGIAIWLAARAFEIGMLRYGKKLQIRELFTRKNRLSS
ncbi:MAG: ABC transporter permease [Chloroflexi bacterium]|jgi:ABC-2 type transport system permease protein|nr:ABC transporter permease [Chloroflexota bacterium]MBT3668642.1 ABC transporter permease [Chloroflexota bacterium]MBT4002013.1 ABC transporter permease [Chloroflexota bacterium]MBT4304145.1 ABC transporter permease [Chloroflexota bacterium]MBT4533221.1 ABC transporter permease [Chloroflexota bacterium]